jgi:hypothetical protein
MMCDREESNRKYSQKSPLMLRKSNKSCLVNVNLWSIRKVLRPKSIGLVIFNCWLVIFSWVSCISHRDLCLQVVARAWHLDWFSTQHFPFMSELYKINETSSENIWRRTSPFILVRTSYWDLS